MISIGVIDSQGAVIDALTTQIEEREADFQVTPVFGMPDISVDYVVLVLELSNTAENILSIPSIVALRDWTVEHHKPVILVSSSAVFGGHRQTLYMESASIDPVSDFGRFCSDVEQAFLENPQTLVLRTGWLFHLKKTNWLGRAVDQFQNGLEIDFPPDQTGNPTSNIDVARVLLALIQQLTFADNPALWTTYHYGSVGVVSLHRFCKVVFGELSTVLACPLATIFSSGYDEVEMRHQFGKNTALDCHKVLSDFGIKQRSWLQDFAVMLQELSPQPEED